MLYCCGLLWLNCSTSLPSTVSTTCCLVAFLHGDDGTNIEKFSHDEPRLCRCNFVLLFGAVMFMVGGVYVQY